MDEVKAVLRDQTQRDLEHWLSTPLEPARSDAPQHNTILLIPKAPLKRLVTYTVFLSAKVDGSEPTPRASINLVTPAAVPSLAGVHRNKRGVARDVTRLRPWSRRDEPTESRIRWHSEHPRRPSQRLPFDPAGTVS